MGRKPLPGKQEEAMDEWIEIFEGGIQTDSAQNTRDYTDDDLDCIVNNYDPKVDEAPLVFGHPEHNEPAYGWVEALRREGKKVFAKFKQIPEAVQKIIEQGRYKKRSVSLNYDAQGRPTLRHVGLLGAMKPAIKGLADIKFKESNDKIAFFYFENNGGKKMDEKEKEIQALKETVAQFAERDKEKDKEIADLKAREISSEFAEKAKQKEEEVKQLKAQVEKLKKEKDEKDSSDFCDGLTAQGLLKPADRSLVMGLQDMARNVGTYEFSEGGKKNALEEIRNFLKTGLKKQIEFSEIVTKGKAGTQSPDVPSNSMYSEFEEKGFVVNQRSAEIHQKAKAYQLQHNVTYEEAWKKVRRGE